MKATHFFFLMLVIFSAPAWCEYRAYQYMVKTNDPYATANRAPAQYITSTLNPQMFRSYHGGNSVSVDLLRTWICPGYTGRKNICPHPYDQEVKK